MLPDQVLFGLLFAAIVAAQIVTGRIAWVNFPGEALQREKAPRAFWSINALMAAGSAYLIYRGFAH